MRSTGFTLIEAMVTLAVAALMLLAVAPGINGWMVGLRIRDTADSIHAGLQIARQEAVRRNQSVSLWLVSANGNVLDSSCALSSRSGSWVVSLQSPVGACAAATSTTAAPMLVTSQVASATGLSVTATQADATTAATTITFNGYGRVANASALARVDIASATNPTTYRSLRVTVGGTGAIRICDPKAASDDPRYCPG